MITPIYTNREYSQKWPKHIVLHHTAELGLKFGDIVLDTQDFQTNKLINHYYSIKKEIDPPYHYSLEKVKDDYQIIAMRPLFVKSHFEDLDPIYDTDIHVSLLGNYDIDIPERRLYKVLTNRLLIPLTKMFRLDDMSIVLHRDISKDDTITCPGEFIHIDVIRSMFRQLRRKIVIKIGQS